MPNNFISPTNQDEVLNGVVAILVNRLQISERYVYQTEKPLVEVGNPPSGDFWVTVSPGPGDFPDEFQEGGGFNTLMEFATTLVTGYTRIRLDGTDRADNLLHDLKRGILPVKRRLLKALAGQELQDSLGNPIGIRLIGVRRANAPDYDKQKATGWITIEFATPFQWDMT